MEADATPFSQGVAIAEIEVMRYVEKARARGDTAWADALEACKVNGGNFQDSVNWSATVNGEIIKSYCPWVWQNANRKKHCKQMQNNVLVSTACPCACAGY